MDWLFRQSNFHSQDERVQYGCLYDHMQANSPLSSWAHCILMLLISIVKLVHPQAPIDLGMVWKNTIGSLHFQLSLVQPMIDLVVVQDLKAAESASFIHISPYFMSISTMVLTSF